MLMLLRRSEEHTSELQSRLHLVCRLLLEKKKRDHKILHTRHRTPGRYTATRPAPPSTAVPVPRVRLLRYVDLSFSSSLSFFFFSRKPTPAYPSPPPPPPPFPP